MRKAAVLAIAAAGVLVAVMLWAARESGEEVAHSLPRASVEAQGLPSFGTEREAAAVQAVESSQPGNSVTTPSLAEAERLVLRVLHADGLPAQGCGLVLVVGTQAAWSSVSGEDGRVEGPALGARAIAWVGGATLAPARFPLPEPRGEHEIRLPAGELIEGRVEIVGGPPQAVRLGLAPRESADVPEVVRRGLGGTLFGRGDWTDDEAWGLRTRGDGRFRFAGLPVDWKGRFVCEEGYEPDTGVSLEVRAGETARILRLRRVPRLQFRVVMPGTRAAAALASATVITSTVSNGVTRSLICDADGRGSVPLHLMAPTVWAELSLASADGLGRLRQRFELAGRAANELGDIDLGDVELGERWSIPFRAAEPGGAPIEGAIAGVICGESLLSGGTAADGTGHLDGVPPGCPELFVGAAAHETASIALPAEPPIEPLTVTLLPCATLGLHLVSSDGQPRPQLYLAFGRSETLPADDPDGSFHDTAQRLGQRVPKSSILGSYRKELQADGSVRRFQSNRWLLRELGDFELGCVPPGLPTLLRVVDAANHAVWAEEVRLAEGERRVVEVSIAALSRNFELLVTDEQGLPLQGVDVTPRASGEESPDWSEPALGWETDAAGRAELGWLYAPSLDVSCSKDGYASATLRGLAPDVPGHLTLTRGLGLDIVCVGVDGRPARVNIVNAIAGLPHAVLPLDVSEPGQGEDRSARWHVDGLDPGPVKLEVSAGSRRFDFERDASEGTVTLTLPDWGELRVRGLPGAKDSVIPQVVIRPADGEQALDCVLKTSDLERDELLVPLIFPGRYEVSVLAVGTGNPLAGPDIVEIRAGETATVTLHAAVR
jgi:hypothetical protein